MQSLFSVQSICTVRKGSACRVEFSERPRIHSVGRSVGRSILPSLGRKLLFVFPLTNAQLDSTKRKMSLNGSANVKNSEAMSDKIITAISAASGANSLAW